MRKFLIVLLLVPIYSFGQFKYDSTLVVDTINNYRYTIFAATKRPKLENYRCSKTVLESYRGFIDDNKIVDDKIDASLKRKVYIDDDDNNTAYGTIRIDYKTNKIRITIEDIRVYDDGNKNWIELNSKPNKISDEYRKDKVLSEFVPGLELHNDLLKMYRSGYSHLGPVQIMEFKRKVLNCLSDKLNDNW